MQIHPVQNPHPTRDGLVRRQQRQPSPNCKNDTPALSAQKIWQSNLHLWPQLADSPVGLWCNLVAPGFKVSVPVVVLLEISVESVPGAA